MQSFRYTNQEKKNIYMLLYDWALIESIPTWKYFNLLVYKFNEKTQKWRNCWTFNQIVYFKWLTFLKEPSNANNNNECHWIKLLKCGRILLIIFKKSNFLRINFKIIQSIHFKSDDFWQLNVPVEALSSSRTSPALQTILLSLFAVNPPSTPCPRCSVI